MFFKQRIQSLNRIVIPGAIIDSLGLHPGDEVYMTSDGERIYISPSKGKMPKLMATFDRGTGIIITREFTQPTTKEKIFIRDPYTKLEEEQDAANNS